MDLHVAAQTDTGRVRDQNEDTILAEAPLIAVADGMGGHVGGEVASGLAVEVLGRYRDRLEGRSAREVSDELREAFREAHRVVYEKGRDEPSLAGMGTTMTAGWVVDDTLALAHVGDSRAYLLRGDALEQLTQDQNVAQEWVRRGKISEEEAASSPQRHVLLQAIGADTDDIDVATATVELSAGDRIVICSDGLHGMLKESARLREILLENPDRDDACRALIDAANAAGGGDNISVVIADIGEPTGQPPAIPVVVDHHESPAPAAAPLERRAPAPERSALSRRTLLIGLGALLLVAVMAVVFVLRPAATGYVVSSRRGTVVLLEGQPGDNTKAARGEIVRVFRNDETDEFPVTTQRQLRAGISVDSVAEAESVIARLPRRGLRPGETPTPEPTPTNTPKPTKKPTPKPSATATP